MIPAVEVELLGKGIVADGPSRAGFALNMYKRNGRWIVRPGFGQVAQIDTTLGTPPADGTPGAYADAVWGYVRTLGTFLLDTDFGHEQLCTLLVARVYTGVTNHLPTLTSPHLRVVHVLRIWDLTTDAHWEEPLHEHTSDLVDEAGTPMWAWHACEETAQPNVHGSYQTEQWSEDGGDREAWFTTFRGKLIFGCRTLGAWFYDPADFDACRFRQVGNMTSNPYSPPHGESPLCKRIKFVDGPLSDGFEYLTDTDLYAPDFAFHYTTLGRILYVKDRAIYFSDIGSPASVIGGNTGNALFLPIDEPISALAELNGSLYVFTARKTLVYQPPNNANLVTQGRLTPLSDAIGCIGPMAVATPPHALVWADVNGVHTTGGGLAIETISRPIDVFFNDKLVSPLAHFSATSGSTPATTTQPQSEFRFEPTGARMFWHADQDLIVLVQPGQNAALVLTEGEWSLWSFESAVRNSVATGLNEVGTAGNIVLSGLCSNGRRLILTGGDVQTVIGSAPAHTAWQTLIGRSIYHCEWGRGGALDRSVDDEDQRTVAGRYTMDAGLVDTYARFYVGKPIQLNERWLYQTSPAQRACPVGADGTREEHFLFPVMLVPEVGSVVDLPLSTSNFTGFNLIVRFDNVRWAPVLRTIAVDSTVATELALEFPPERLRSVLGYAMGALSTPDPATFREAQVYSAGVPAVGGNELRIRFNGSAAAIPPATWTAQPGLALAPSQQNLLFYVPMRRLRAFDASQNVNGDPDWSVITPPELFIGAHVAAASLPAIALWRQTQFWLQAQGQAVQRSAEATAQGRRRRDHVAQPVDWLYEGPEIEGEGRHKLRGVRVRVKSRGRGDELDSGSQGWAAWPARLLNFMFASDRKDDQSQIVDWSAASATGSAGAKNAIEGVADKEGTRLRAWDSSTATMVPVSYGDVRYADPAVPATGNVLVAGDEVSETVVSDSVKGAQTRVVLWGHVFSKASVLVFEKITALVRPIGNKVRRGRDR